MVAPRLQADRNVTTIRALEVAGGDEVRHARHRDCSRALQPIASDADVAQPSGAAAVLNAKAGRAAESYLVPGNGDIAEAAGALMIEGDGPVRDPLEAVVADQQVARRRSRCQVDKVAVIPADDLGVGYLEAAARILLDGDGARDGRDEAGYGRAREDAVADIDVVLVRDCDSDADNPAPRVEAEVAQAPGCGGHH